MIDGNELIECDTGKHKSSEFVCRIARSMQEQDNNVSFSEIEDAIININTLGQNIKNMQDLKDVIRPALAKSETAVKAFNKAFPEAMSDTFGKKTKIESTEALEKELV